ncbi:MAG: hypothetical protein CO017_04845 [Zetaproteobacteria bacterium CG_4_8_14_3_um_filter_59_5]|nr:MAG: hypothetical protein CO017_04845 [Zetaproteobacteria bacterium CG_4_8_14_3_um_filter_59_5]
MSELISSLSADPAGLFGMLFNLLIIAAVGGLWLMWARSMNRQKNVEDMLAATSGQLEEATRHLENALQEIRRLQRSKPVQEDGRREHKSTAPSADNKTVESAVPAPQGLSHPMHAAYRQAQTTPAGPVGEAAIAQAASAEPLLAAEQPVATAAAATDSREDGQSDVQSIIHLHSLGQPAEQIASQLDMPLARINLLLRLHEQRSGERDSR